MRTVALAILTLVAASNSANAVCVLGMGSCEDVPQLDNFTAYLQQETQKDCQQFCNFVSASKSDGQSQEFGGVKMYEMRANIRVQALQPLAWYGPGAMNGWIVIGKFGGLFQSAHNANQGETIDIPVILHFQKFESGWKINSIARM
jgi:hypothetical protein